MTILYEYLVIQHYEDGPPEPFGQQMFSKPPIVGDTIQLKWLDGSWTGNYYIKRVDDQKKEIHVMASECQMRESKTVKGINESPMQTDKELQLEYLKEIEQFLEKFVLLFEEKSYSDYGHIGQLINIIRKLPKQIREISKEPQYMVTYDPGASINSFGNMMPNQSIAQWILTQLESNANFIIPSNFGISVKQPDGTWIVLHEKESL